MGFEVYITAAVTIVGAGISVYTGVKVALTEISGEVKSNRKDIERQQKEIDKLWDRVVR